MSWEKRGYERLGLLFQRMTKLAKDSSRRRYDPYIYTEWMTRQWAVEWALMILQQLQDYIRDLVPNLTQLKGMEPNFLQFYVVTAAKKFSFFLDTNKTGKIKIVDMLASFLIEELFNVRTLILVSQGLNECQINSTFSLPYLSSVKLILHLHLVGSVWDLSRRSTVNSCTLTRIWTGCWALMNSYSKFPCLLSNWLTIGSFQVYLFGSVIAVERWASRLPLSIVSSKSVSPLRANWTIKLIWSSSLPLRIQKKCSLSSSFSELWTSTTRDTWMPLLFNTFTK